MTPPYRVEQSTPAACTTRETRVAVGAGRSPARAVGPSMAHGCAAFAPAVGPAPMLSHDAPGAIHGEPPLACPDGQVLPQAKEADHTQAIEGEAMQANSDNTQLRIMHIM